MDLVGFVRVKIGDLLFLSCFVCGVICDLKGSRGILRQIWDWLEQICQWVLLFERFFRIY